MTVETRPTRWSGTIVAAFATFLVIGATTAGLGASVPYFAERFGLASGAGAVMTAYNAGSFLAVAVGGALRVSTRATIVTAIALFGAGCLGLGLAGSWTAFWLGAGVAGAGFGLLCLMLNTTFAGGFGADSTVMVNRLNAMFGVGAVTGPLVVGALGRDGFGWFPLTVAVLIACCLPVARLRRAEPLPVAPTGRAGDGRWVFWLCLIGFLYAGTEMSIGTWLSTQLTHSGWTARGAATATSAFWIGMVVGRLALPPLTRGRPPGPVVTGHLAVGTARLAVAAIAPLTPFAYLAAGLAIAPALPTVFAWLAATAAEPGRASTLFVLANMAATVVMPTAVGTVVRPSAPWLIALTIAGCCAVTAAVTGRVTLRDRVSG